VVTKQSIQYYPHWLTIAADANTSVFNEETGVWEEVAVTAKPKRYKCRAQSNTVNAFITSESGQRIDYSWIVHLPYDAPIILQGKPVTITGKDHTGQTIVLANDTVKRYFKSQLHTRIWL
jgi:hypothetical protein